MPHKESYGDHNCVRFCEGKVKISLLSIISTLSLILAIGHQHFSVSDNQEMIKLILKEGECLTYSWPRKLYIISLSSLIQNHHL